MQCQQRRTRVPTPDDERFETYLKQFQPLLPKALPINERARTLSRYWVFGIWSAGVTAMIILSVISVRIILRPVSRPGKPMSVTVNSPMPPLSMHHANSLLATAPSYQAALEEMAFHPQRS